MCRHGAPEVHRGLLERRERDADEIEICIREERNESVGRLLLMWITN